MKRVTIFETYFWLLLFTSAMSFIYDNRSKIDFESANKFFNFIKPPICLYNMRTTMRNRLPAPAFLLLLISTLALGQQYKPPVFTDSARVKKIALAFPAIEKIYHDFAVKNHFPGLAFGVVVDGKLLY